jgi:hypothetical protein
MTTIPTTNPVLPPSAYDVQLNKSLKITDIEIAAIKVFAAAQPMN